MTIWRSYSTEFICLFITILFNRNDPILATNSLKSMDVRNVHPNMIEGNNGKLRIEDDEKRGALSDMNFQSGVSTGSDLAAKRHFNKGPICVDEHLRRSKQMYSLCII